MAPRKLPDHKLQRITAFLSYIRPFRITVVLLFLTILVSTCVVLPIPLIQKAIIDTAIPVGDISLVFRLAGAVFVLYMVNHLATFVQNYLSARIRQKVLTLVRMDMYSHLQKMSLTFYSRRQTGSLLSRLMNDVSFIQNLVNDQLFTLVSSFVKIIAIAVILIRINLTLLLACLAILPGIIVIFMIYRKIIYRDVRRLQETQESLSGKIQENLVSMKLIQAENLEEVKRKETYEYSRRLEEVSIRRNMNAVTGNLLMTVISNPVLYVVMWGLGGYFVAIGKLSLGSLLAFVQYIFSVIGPVTLFFRIGMDLQAGFAALDRIYEVLDEKQYIADTPEAKDIDAPISLLRFNRVSCRLHDPDHRETSVTVLKDINFSMARGEKVALVGPSGCGKTSLIHCILRFYQVCDGSIEVNGNDIAGYTIKSLRRRIAYMPQEQFLFNDTIRGNLTFGAPVDEGVIREALRRARIETFVDSLPEGLDTIVGERGVKLSGGERQRIALARMFCKKPDIFIFDEAFSAIDAHAEKMIHDMLDEIIGASGAIIITHRFSILKRVDTVIVMDNGEIVEKGSLPKLLEKKNTFYHLYKSQEG